MAAIRNSRPILAVPTNEQLLGEKKVCGNFHTDTPKSKRLVRVYTDGHIYIDADLL